MANYIDLKLERGPFQNNGASPWFAHIPVGSAKQALKFNLDTGVNYNWVTSSLCSPHGCVHHGGLRFDYERSSSFEKHAAPEKIVDFGPWGKMTVETGSDRLVFTGNAALRTNLHLSKEYTGRNFEELNWDGGIGLPCGTDFLEPDSSLIIQQLLENKILDQGMKSVSITIDMSDKSRICRIGDVGDLSANRRTHIFLEWDRYTAAGPKYEYVWTCKLDELKVGKKVIATDIQLCLDTGSSGFKGDKDIVTRLLSQTFSDNKSITLRLGKTDNGEAGLIKLPPKHYNVKIEAGADKDKIVPQFFTDVSMPKLLIVGSVLLDSMVTQFEYRVERSSAAFRLCPIGVHLYK